MGRASIVRPMRIRWDWLQAVMTAPYVPTLGPTHPQAITPQLFAEAVEITGTGRFLPYDKDRRWGDRKDEHVLAEAIAQQPGLVLVPTFSSRSRASRSTSTATAHTPSSTGPPS